MNRKVNTAILLINTAINKKNGSIKSQAHYKRICREYSDFQLDFSLKT